MKAASRLLEGEGAGAIFVTCRCLEIVLDACPRPWLELQIVEIVGTIQASRDDVIDLIFGMMLGKIDADTGKCLPSEDQPSLGRRAPGYSKSRTAYPVTLIAAKNPLGASQGRQSEGGPYH